MPNDCSASVLEVMMRLLVCALFMVILAACNGDDSYMYHSYCETYQCKASTEVRQRPTSFMLELQLNDSSESHVARLYTVNCDYLDGEDSTQLSTFCVDSLKYGDSDSLRHLPQKNKNTYDNLTYMYANNDGYILTSYASIPVDDDGHLRFTLVDREKKEKSIDLDLSAFVGMYKVHGDTFDFVFPPNTVFTYYDRGIVGEGSGPYDCEGMIGCSDESGQTYVHYGCYEYARDSAYIDTSYYCALPDAQLATGGYIVDASGTFGYVKDSSVCLHNTFTKTIAERTGRSYKYINCYKTSLNPAPETLTVSHLYSVQLVNDSLQQAMPENVQLAGPWGHLHAWHTKTLMEKQGPYEEDSFEVYVFYKGN